MSLRSNRPREQAEFQVGPDTHVIVSYTLYDADGEELAESAPEGLSFLFGYGQLPPSVEAALAGATKGQSRNVTLKPEDAFGQRNPDRIIEVERAELPADAEVGDRFEAEGEGDSLLMLSVLELTEEVAVLDTNHPLAGQDVRITLEVDEVRPASPQELVEVQAELAEGQPGQRLILPERLLRGARRRYEE